MKKYMNFYIIRPVLLATVVCRIGGEYEQSTLKFSWPHCCIQFSYIQDLVKLLKSICSFLVDLCNMCCQACVWMQTLYELSYRGQRGQALGRQNSQCGLLRVNFGLLLFFFFFNNRSFQGNIHELLSTKIRKQR